MKEAGKGGSGLLPAVFLLGSFSQCFAITSHGPDWVMEENGLSKGMRGGMSL